MEVAPRLLESLGAVHLVPEEGWDEEALYPAVSLASRQLIEGLSLEKRPDSESLLTFEKVFAQAEEILKNGDPEARTLIIVGFLEDLVDWVGHDVLLEEVVAEQLGPRCLEAWKNLRQLWQSRKSLMDVMNPAGFFEPNPQEQIFESWLEEMIR